MKSSPPDRSFATFVRRALDAIRAEVPWAHEALRGALSGRTTLVVVDGEPAAVRTTPGDRSGAGQAVDIEVLSRRLEPDVVCTTTSRAIVDLIRGRNTLLDAVLSDRVELTGDVSALVAFHDALLLFLHGAVRARAFEGLLQEFQTRLHDA